MHKDTPLLTCTLQYHDVLYIDFTKLLVQICMYGKYCTCLMLYVQHIKTNNYKQYYTERQKKSVTQNNINI